MFPPRKCVRKVAVPKPSKRKFFAELLLLLLGGVWVLEATAKIEPSDPFCVVDGDVARCDELCSPELESRGQYVRSLTFTGRRLAEECAFFIPHLKVRI
jgi:hypothetical protein